MLEYEYWTHSGVGHIKFGRGGVKFAFRQTRRRTAVDPRSPCRRLPSSTIGHSMSQLLPSVRPWTCWHIPQLMFTCTLWYVHEMAPPSSRSTACCRLPDSTHKCRTQQTILPINILTLVCRFGLQRWVTWQKVMVVELTIARPITSLTWSPDGMCVRCAQQTRLAWRMPQHSATQIIHMFFLSLNRVCVLYRPLHPRHHHNHFLRMQASLSPSSPPMVSWPSCLSNRSGRTPSPPHSQRHPPPYHHHTPPTA